MTPSPVSGAGPDNEWLKSLCSTEQSRAKQIGHPWTVERGCEPWTIATDGHLLVAVRGNHGFPDANNDAPNFARVLDPTLSAPARILPLGELRALAMPWLGVKNECAVCKGCGEIECDECDGNGSIPCSCRCGDEHERDCDACDGLGWSPCDACPKGAKDARETRPVWIDEAPFDLRLFARVLGHITAEEVPFRQQLVNRAARLDLPDMIVLIMPLSLAGAELPRYANAPRIATHPAEELTNAR